MGKQLILLWVRLLVRLRSNKCEDISKVKDLVTRMELPDKVPCIVVYYPSHNSFEMYDAIVASYDTKKNRNLWGYQLKEGKEIPKLEADDICQRSFVIRGKAAKSGLKKRSWIVASEKAIENLMGESGMHWTPKAWAELSKK